MSYEIIQVMKSRNGFIGYFIYRQSVQTYGKIIYTYGISASNVKSVYSIDDVFTDLDEIIDMLGIIADNSVAVENLHEFVINYLSNM